MFAVMCEEPTGLGRLDDKLRDEAIQFQLDCFFWVASRSLSPDGALRRPDAGVALDDENYLDNREAIKRADRSECTTTGSRRGCRHTLFA
jgi:hypothetical protein